MEPKQRLKTLKDLNLMDRFLFAKAMEREDVHTALLEIILGKEVVLVSLAQTEKEFRTTPLRRSIRVDVLSADEDTSIYNTEVQKKNTYNLPKRTRYYRALIDSGLLLPGEINFNKLCPVYVIMIASFDLFGQGLYRYSFRMTCKERPELELGDESVCIFLNTKGTHPELVSEELVELLRFVECSTEETACECKSERVRRIAQQVSEIKASEEMEVQFMHAWEEEIYIREEGRKTGEALGLTKGREEGLTAGEACFAALSQVLLRDSRIEDLKKATVDSEYRNTLYEEYGIARNSFEAIEK